MPWFWSSAKGGDGDANGSNTAGTRNAFPPRTNGDIFDSTPSKEPPANPSSSSSSSSSNAVPLNFTPTQTTTACILTTTLTLTALHLYKRHLRRIPNVSHLKPSDLRTRSLHGYVTSVGDADNFRLFHTPGGRLAGWGWLRPLSTDRKWLSDKTIHVRIAGIDAPELAHFGRPPQPFSQEALEWLRAQVLGRYVRVRPFSRDQYHRVVCGVTVRSWVVWERDLGLEMLKAGLATVYEAKSGSEFGGKEEEYRRAEEKAKLRSVGMWKKSGLVGKMLGQKETTLETPREYKSRMAKQDLAK